MASGETGASSPQLVARDGHAESAEGECGEDDPGPRNAEANQARADLALDRRVHVKGSAPSTPGARNRPVDHHGLAVEVTRLFFPKIFTRSQWIEERYAVSHFS